MDNLGFPLGRVNRMASSRVIAAIGVLCANLFSLCAVAHGVQLYRRASSSTSGQHSRRDASNRVIILIQDWDQVPPGADSSAPSHSGSAGESAAVAAHPHRGPAGAPITIVEYSDFQCPFCRAAESTVQQIRAHFGRKVRIVHMDFPLAFHANAMNAALAARCAREQGQFWAYHDALLYGSSGLSKPALDQLASTLGLHSANFDRCLDHREYASAIESDIAEGRESGVSGTPTFVVNGKIVVGTPALPEFERIVDASLAAQARK
jgi:protein-disulfide isomerase